MSHDTERANAVNLRAQVAILRSQLAESQARECGAREALESADATLCSCRYKSADRPTICNCDIHAAHRIIQAALAASGPCKHAAEVKALGEQLESDRTAVADGVTAANKAIDSRHWLTEGRGSYEWNDDLWHDEFRAAALEIKAALEPLAKIAADWKGCPQTGAEVAKARINLTAEVERLKRTNGYLGSKIEQLGQGINDAAQLRAVAEGGGK